MEPPVCIAGMHRSGTSMLARALHLSGLHLGDDADLLPATDDNPDGYWEHHRVVELNDVLLAAAGGGWDAPPSAEELAAACETDLLDVAREVVHLLAARTPWGWKDPRCSLTLPLWEAAADGLRVIECVRHPLEVAMSLRRRGMFSFGLSLRLWSTYHAQLDEHRAGGRHLVVHYAAMLADPVGQLARATEFIGATPTAPKLADAAATIRRDRSHTRFSMRDLLDADAPPEIIDQYVELCRAADWTDVADAAALRATDVAGAVLHDQVSRLQSIAPRGQATTPGPAIAELAGEVAQLRSSLVDLQAAYVRDTEELHRSLYHLAATVARSPHASEHEIAYQEVVQRARELAREHLPSTARCLVASKGDPELLRAFGRRLAHFPRGADGGYLGHHPSSDLAAIAGLESARFLDGFDHLFVPEPQRWWLEHYGGFVSHLDRVHERVVDGPGIGTLFALGGGARAAADPISDALERVRFENDQEPIALDLRADGAAPMPSWLRTFRPPIPSDRLPYRDHTVDVVLCDPAQVSEARRIARSLVVVDDGGRLDMEIEAGDQRPPSCSIVIPTYGQQRLLVACLRSLAETLPRWMDVEVIVVDDCSPTWSDDAVAEPLAAVSRSTLIRSAVNRGFLGSAMAGAEAATGEVLLFLNDDTVLLPGWLPPLVRRALEPGVGAVGGRLVFPDGSLQEAGCAIFVDGSAAKVGYGDPDPAGLPYAHRRDVDYCSGALLATRRSLFFEIGGFDQRYAPGYYEDTDYCTSLRAAGLRVVYEPDSTIVHVEGGTAGVDVSQGMKRYQVLNRERFLERWATFLRAQPVRPDVEDGLTLVHLARPAVGASS